jgi:hypothetical protein
MSVNGRKDAKKLGWFAQKLSVGRHRSLLSLCWSRCRFLHKSQLSIVPSRLEQLISTSGQEPNLARFALGAGKSRTSVALRFFVVPFTAFFFCGRDGFTSPSPKTSSGRSQLARSQPNLENVWDRTRGSWHQLAFEYGLY